MPYRLGLDIGANSIGWACLKLDAGGLPAGLLDIGVRIYPDGRNPKDGSSLAVARRVPRSMRRRRDRYLTRRAQLLATLRRFGLMAATADEQKQIAALDPYKLRQEALHRCLEPFELGRALFHINQRRGFKSNRKLDRGNEEAGKVKEAETRLRMELTRAGAHTLGDWLATRHTTGQPVRVRLAGTGKTAAYEFYPSRTLLEDEFNTIWKAQSGWNSALTEKMRATLHRIIFYQRPLKPVPVGKCWLETGEERASRALPITQRFRIAQTVSHLRVSEPGMPERRLAQAEREILLAGLYRGQPIKIADIIKKTLKLPPETDLHFRDNEIKGDATALRLAGAPKAKTPAPIGPAWHEFELATQSKIVETILSYEDAEDLSSGIAALAALGLTRDQAERAILQSLPDGHVSLSAKAMLKILPHLEAGMTYDKGVQAAGYAHHSDTRTGEIREVLPYYGELLAERIGTGTGEAGDPLEKRYGRAPNPTVHIALNEIRRVVNAIIARHGPPTEIVVETLRDLGRSAKQRQEEDKKNRENQKANDKRREIVKDLGLRVNAQNMVRLRLWEEQAEDPKNRCCPYTGTLITPRLALSDEVEEDHILPFAQTLDDSMANRMLVYRDANRAKARRTPYQAFGHTPQWPDILARVTLLPKQKRWRFEKDGEQKLGPGGDFLARHMTDSATIARWAVFYLDVLAPGKIWSIPGRLTSLLRNELGLNSETLLGKGGKRKDRTDHRHHAIDAVVVALTDRGMLQRISAAAKRADASGARIIKDLGEPWPGFVAELSAKLQTVIVAHKPDTGVQGPLHNDTAYGIIPENGNKGPNVVVRKPVIALAEKPKHGNEATKAAKSVVRDPILKNLIAAIQKSGSEIEQRDALSKLVGPNGSPVRSVRMEERLEGVQKIRDRITGKPYKAMKLDGNHCAELWRLPNGKYDLQVISRFDAAQRLEAERLGRKIADTRPHPAAKLIMRLHINDMVALGQGENRRIFRVVMTSGSTVTLAPPHEGGNIRDRHRDKTDQFRYVFASRKTLLDDGARKIWVDPSGRIFDPGPIA
jgi:CRISPR-associated endonuclease Csn1